MEAAIQVHFQITSMSADTNNTKFLVVKKKRKNNEKSNLSKILSIS